ncbi:uncharacterized protein LOC124894037, partial [Capsicum annuum]|uniref:uncharacterized protein LOC124894037 n=1 Tax=Capsicum annuum TaxID=4072 RepID=UPI001FB04C5D
MVRDRFQVVENSNLRLRLIGKRGFDGRRYNSPSVSEVAALVVGDFEPPTMLDRDIIIESQSGQLKRINELNASYLGLQYPLLFPYGEDGYRENISLNLKDESSGGRKCVSCREYFSYKIQERKHEDSIIVLSKRLFQQFLVDGYTMIESFRLKFIRLHKKKKLRSHFYKGLEEAILRRDTKPSSQGERVILSSSFTGGARYMLQNYQDTMAICKWAGYPDLYITFTCNSKWAEVARFGKCRRLSPEDRPDILTTIFKIKLDQLLKDLRDNKGFGEVKAACLPRAHILLFLHNKCPNTTDIDDIISAELPDNLVDPQYYATVTMIHGPCGIARKSSPCMQNGKCTKYFSKKFVDSTTVDDEGYPIYRRRDNEKSTKRAGLDLDNSGNTDDSRIVDEINMYCDCRYISSCEAAWRTFKFPIHHKEPSVERLSFHLEGNQNVIFSDDDPIDAVVNRPIGYEEKYYLRLLLNVIKGPTSYEDLRKINGHDHNTYACYALDLLDDGREYVDAIVEAKFNLTDDYLKNLCLQKIEHFLKGCGRSFLDFPTMPMPVYNEEQVDQNNRLICDEMCYNRRALAVEHQKLIGNLTNEQRTVYEKIITVVNKNKGEFFFLYDFGGTGDIVLTVASSGIAALLLPDSTCNIKQDTPLANLIIKAKLIIWGEAQMKHRYCFEALDKSLRDILSFKDSSNSQRPFGGKITIFGGDFRQILPVIPKGSRQDVVNETLNSLYLWSHCQLLQLTKNMRLQGTEIGSDELRDFSDWILAVGDGRIGSSVDGIEK